MQPSRTLFETYAHLNTEGRLLICNPHDVQFVVRLSEQVARLDVFPRDWTMFQKLEARIGQHKHVTIHQTIFPAEEAIFDMALIEIPKGRELARTWMAAALLALHEDGILYAAGPNSGGAKTALADLNTITHASNLGNKARHRIFSALRPADLTIPTEWTQPGDYQRRVLTVHEQSYELVTHPGIFSYDHLDEGTALLLNQLPTLNLPPGLRVLDAGCGIGIIGMVAARSLQPEEVVFADSDLLAIQCVRRSLPGHSVIAADLTQELPAAPFDLILCNPPFHQEHDQSTAFMTAFAKNARRILAPDGSFVLVYNHFLPYRDLLQQHFASLQTLVDDGRYTVIAAH